MFVGTNACSSSPRALHVHILGTFRFARGSSVGLSKTRAACTHPLFEGVGARIKRIPTLGIRLKP